MVIFMITVKCTHSSKDEVFSCMSVLFCLGTPFTLLKLVLCFNSRQLFDNSSPLVSFSILNLLPTTPSHMSWVLLDSATHTTFLNNPTEMDVCFHFSSLRKVFFISSVWYFKTQTGGFHLYVISYVLRLEIFET